MSNQDIGAAEIAEVKETRKQPFIRKVLIWAVILTPLPVDIHLYLVRIRPYLPGNWTDSSFFEPLQWFLLCGVLAYFSLLVALSTRRGIAALLVQLVVIGAVSLPTPSEESRFEAEKARYLEAIQTGEKYGEQHVIELGGRRLTYWRWMRHGVDNSIGVLYDPEDRFPVGDNDEDFDKDEPEFMEMKSVTGGHLWKSQRKGNGLYLVLHS